ncbi:hypothetical protein EYB33_02865 [Lysinibacillus sphaericus]|uniref:hypothetical protein n=1 Tax=Lysinibacillus sphaericus TaxID=1421 RepID=UPI001E4EC2EA|nr:hypothetical protein [Lysinibacillus sphaericus]UDK95258.1 hypothetical protein EYB33_02865 [Lysinibacillus sphaericus]
MKMQKEMEHSINLEIKINELELELIRAKVEKVVIEAYKKGIDDCRECMKFEFSLPLNLKKEHVAQIFQCELPTVEKIIRMDGFPRSHAISARYPRDKVFEWISKNTMYMNERLGIYVTK